jgi:glycosyltransferase involved in cell wall biosynthesis
MKISIVTPSFNQGSFIEQAIRSVLAQGIEEVEHIIVDNCSSDETSAVLEKYSHLKVICEKDQGQSDALNKGFRAATGDIVGWLNADDIYLPGALNAARQAFEEQPLYDIVYGDYRFVDAKGRLIRVRKETGFDYFVLKYLHVLYIPTTTTFFRRRIFEQGNFLDIAYHYAMDYEFFVRLAAKGYKFGHIRRLMADFRWHDASKSQTQASRQKREMEQALLVHDPFLRSLNGGGRFMLRNLFMCLARSKRTLIKIFCGAYWCRI